MTYIMVQGKLKSTRCCFHQHYQLHTGSHQVRVVEARERFPWGKAQLGAYYTVNDSVSDGEVGQCDGTIVDDTVGIMNLLEWDCNAVFSVPVLERTARF